MLLLINRKIEFTAYESSYTRRNLTEFIDNKSIIMFKSQILIIFQQKKYLLSREKYLLSRKKIPARREIKILPGFIVNLEVECL